MLNYILGSVVKHRNCATTIKNTKNHNFIKNKIKMYNSGFGGYFGNSGQGVNSIPLHTATINNHKINKNYHMESGSINKHWPFRKVFSGELRLPDAGSSVEISGRIQSQRLGRFLSLRDDTGITQLIVPDDRIDIQRRFRNTPLNSFLVKRGFATIRPDKSRNEKMATGAVEVLIENLLSVHPKRKKDDSDSDDEDFRRNKKRASINSASLKLTSEELSKCSTPSLIKHFSLRSHTCGELNKRLIGKSITLCGWVSAKRVGRFVMLKDGHGSVQIVPEIQNVALTNKFQNLHIDSILIVKGVVSLRPPGHENPREENGHLEILVKSLTVVNPRDTVPPKEEGGEGNEDGNIPKKDYDNFIKNEEIEEKSEPSMPNPNKYTYRTHTCGELNEKNVGQKVRLIGWVEFLRMDKFILLRDKYGSTQLLIPDSRTDLQSLTRELSFESVVLAEGTVCSRPPGEENTKQKTGSIEVSLTDVKILNPAKANLPFCVREVNKPKEHVRMMYRYIDLRHESMQHNLRLRSNILFKMRRFLIEHLDFLEVETPTLFKKTPGGAQEFVVPTRQGKFYSLVQSPQLFKQLLMVGSVDRYFQIARCYRDETVESDRQPEFTQLDIEMSFCEREDMLNLIEDLLKYCWPENMPPLTTPFPRMTYEEAMDFYGTDKPDLRFGWKFSNFTSLFKDQVENCNGKIDIRKFMEKEEFAVYGFVAHQGGPKFSASAKKMFLDNLKEKYPTSHLYFFPVKSVSNTQTVLESLFCSSVAEEIKNLSCFDADDVLIMAFGPKEDVLKSLGELRIKFANYLEEKKVENLKNNTFNFLWVVDFPLFEKEGSVIQSCHHPFTQPHPNDIHLLETDPLKVKSLHYDLVLNGREVGGGSIRIHDPVLQKTVLEKILKLDAESMSFFFDALGSGAPPHGGIALGLDRLIAILCGASGIRDVIAFPKNRMGQDIMSGAPCDISEEEKKLYHIRIPLLPTCRHQLLLNGHIKSTLKQSSSSSKPHSPNLFIYGNSNFTLLNPDTVYFLNNKS